jgi:indolepyruvate ferredoxin oxidoreductase alpha subunit
MTGQQENPGTGYTLMGEETNEADIPAICKAIGIKGDNIYLVNPLRLDETDAALEDALSKQEPTVIITRWPCILKRFSDRDKAEFDLSPKQCRIDQEKCTKCRVCVNTGCPAIYSGKEITINGASCTGCEVCKQACRFGAIETV